MLLVKGVLISIKTFFLSIDNDHKYIKLFLYSLKNLQLTPINTARHDVLLAEIFFQIRGSPKSNF